MTEKETLLKRWLIHWDRFFFQSADTTLCAVIRIAFALVLLPYLLVLGMNLEPLWGESGVLPFAVSQALLDSDALSPLGFLAPNETTLYLSFLCFFLQVIFLLFGVKSRFQAFGVFFWLMAFQHRNNLTIDGGDTLARLTAFYLFCMPCGERLSVDQWWRAKKGHLPRFRSIWGLRLLQIQMTLLYASTAILKLQGAEWKDGTALMYVVQLHDVYGRFPLPGFLFESLVLLKGMTWIVVSAEILIPIGLWVKSTRVLTVCLAMAFHLAIDYSMNLFLFQWFMIVGLLSFCSFQTPPLKFLSSWGFHRDVSVKT